MNKPTLSVATLSLGLLAACGAPQHGEQHPPQGMRAAPAMVQPLPDLATLTAASLPVLELAASASYAPPTAAPSSAARTLDFEDEAVGAAIYAPGVMDTYHGGTGAPRVRALLRSRHGAFARCLEAQRSLDPEAAGRAVLHLVFDAAGALQNATIASVDQRVATMAPCLVNVARTLRLGAHHPRSMAALTVNYPLLFAAP